MEHQEGEQSQGQQAAIDPTASTVAASSDAGASAGAVDTAFIADKLGIDSNALNSVDESILIKMKVKFDEFETLKSEKLVLEVNLEQANHMTAKRFEVMKTRLTKLTNENTTLKQSLDESKQAQHKSDEMISQLELGQNTNNKKLQETEDAIASAEKEKRHLFEIVKRREDENKSLQNELDQLSKSNKELRGELIALETSSQKNSSELLKIKFEKNNISQELEIMRKNSSWYEVELGKKMEELKTFKVDKYKEFSSLQSDLENTRNELQSLTSKYDHLKQNFATTSKKLDDSLVTIKNLNDKIAFNKEDFAKEMSSKDKLIEILNKSNDERKNRIQDLQSSFDSIRSENVKASSDLKVQLDKTKKELQISNAKVQQLQASIDDLTSSGTYGAAIPGAVSDLSLAGSLPSTPRALKQFQDVTLSPSAEQTLSKIGNGVSLTQLYSDFQFMKKQLIKERRLKENLEKQVNQFVQELNRQVPAITATKERCSMLEAELTDISILLEKTAKDKDTLLDENKNWKKKLNEYEMELNTLNKTKIDLSKQVSHLVIQLSLKSDGNAPLTQQEKDTIGKMVAQYSNDGFDDESDTDRLISERLVKFKSIVEMTQKNQELLKITRQLGNQLENQEKLNHEKMDNLESVAIDEAREAIIVLQDQIGSLEGKLASVSRERDMFRSIAGGHKQAIPQGNVFNSTPNSTALDMKDMTMRQEGLETDLQQVQQEYKTYRQETESTMKILNKQLHDLTNAKSDLAVQLARATSSTQLYEERYKSIQETLKYTKSETAEIRKRSNILQDSLARHDVSNKQLTEELIQTKSMIESFNLEISNLKAEKQLWKSIEKRLNDENSSLLDERLRLNNLTADLQRLENERNQNFNESTSRLNSTISSLEEELTLLKSKLEVNTDELRSALLRKDTDAKAYQERIDALRDELAATKEDLIKRKSLNDQFESTVMDLQRQLHSANEQLASYDNLGAGDDGDNVEKVLRKELQKAKSELESTLNELNSANDNIEQFKSIANAAEKRLSELSDSYDEYKTNVEAKLKETQEMSDSLMKQVAESNDTISSLQQKLSEAEKSKDSVVADLHSEIESLKIKASSTDKVREEYEAKIDLFKKDLEEQAKIANDCQQNYEQELQKHAEVSKVNTKLREDESALKIKIHELTIESRDSKNALVTSQESWENQKLTLEEELKSAENRVSDLNLQNRMLLNQLEQLTRQQRESLASSNTGTGGGSSTVEYSGDKPNFDELEGSSEELLQVVAFLRHEKEISDAQLDVANQEARRLKQNLDITRQELEDVKSELAKTQTKQLHSVQLEQNYKELSEKINQLDLLRESNNTLRQESQSYSAQVKSLEAKLQENLQKVEPLELQVVNLRAELETKSKECESEKSIVEFWKNKNQELLQNYNRIDPDEHNSLKQKVQDLSPLSGQVDELKAKITEMETNYAEERKKSIREVNERLAKFRGIIDSTKKELTEEKQRSADLQKEIEALQKALSESVNSSSNITSPDHEALAKITQELQATKQSLIAANSENERKLMEVSAARDDLAKQIQSLQETSTQTPDTEAMKASFAKEREDLINQKNQELEQMKFKLKIEVKKELEQENKASGPAGSKVETAVDIEALKSQWQSEHEKEIEQKVKEACEALKSKIREPHETKINAIVNKRFEKLKQEAESEIKKKEEELMKKYEINSGADSKALQDEIDKLKQSIDTECKKAREEGRTSALKEGEMRFKMTKRQLDKAKEELAALKPSSANTPSSAPAVTSNTAIPAVQPSSMPSKPAVGNPSANNNNNNSSRIPTHNFREALKKPQILKPNDEQDQQEQQQGVKRGSDSSVQDDAVADKKPKNV